MIRRVLTIRQPWASLIMAGVKDVENRTWPVPSTLPQWYRCNPCGDLIQRDTGGFNADHDCSPAGTYWRVGPFPCRLWIHAGKTYPHRDDAPEAWAAYERHVGIVRDVGSPDYYEPWTGVLLGSVLFTGCHGDGDCLRFTGLCSPWAERDRFHWTLTDPRPLPEPIPMKGRQGLWRLPADVAVPA